MSKKHIFLRVFSKITISVCVFCAFFISPVFATLPAGYTELEYIESTGTQYIDTEIYGTDKTEVSVKYIVTDISTTSGFGIIGYQEGFQKSPSFQRVTWTNMGNDQFRYGKNVTESSIRATINTVVEEIFGNGSWRKNGVRVPIATVETFTTSPKTMVLFALRNADTIMSMAKMKLYFCSIKDNGNFIRDFIPARRNSDNEIGMYDTVSNTFFTNSGTGDFIAGPIAHCKTVGTDGVMCTACESGYKLDSNGGCVSVIEIATTKMVDDEFAAAEAKLATTVQTIESVVSRTITQTGQIQVLQDTKQTRPDESCPANMKCLLVQDEDGTPHWYPIIEP